MSYGHAESYGLATQMRTELCVVTRYSLLVTFDPNIPECPNLTCYGYTTQAVSHGAPPTSKPAKLLFAVTIVLPWQSDNIKLSFPWVVSRQLKTKPFAVGVRT